MIQEMTAEESRLLLLLLEKNKCPRKFLGVEETERPPSGEVSQSLGLDRERGQVVVSKQLQTVRLTVRL